MSTLLGPFALLFSKNWNANQASGVCVCSVVAIGVLFLQFECFAWAALVGSFIGLVIREMAAAEALAVRKSVNEISVRCSREREESNSLANNLKSFAASTFICFMRKSFFAVVETFAKLGIVHVGLSNSLLPCPVLSRA